MKLNVLTLVCEQFDEGFHFHYSSMNRYTVLYNVPEDDISFWGPAS